MLEIYFESYGCTANHNSTEIMKGLVKQAGLNITENIDSANLILINSCIVKQPTQEKIRRRIQNLLVQNKKIILAGCMSNFLDKSLKDKVGNNLFLLNTNHIGNIANLIKDIKENNYDSDKYLKHRSEIKLNKPKIPKHKLIGINQISEGCLNECSYCIVRLVKGKLFSYPQEQIINSIKKDIESGCREIWITSQDNASYGLEDEKHQLPELLKRILNLKGNFFLRLGMMNPDNVLKILQELIEIYKHRKMFKFLHIPIQSGSNKILKSMNRSYNKKDIIQIARAFKRQVPEITLSTDIIVGFPGETEKDFQESIDIIREIKPEILNISKFWPHEQTKASKLNQISSKIRAERAAKLARLHMNICNELQKPWLDKTAKVLVDQKGFSNTWLARSDNYKLFAVQSREKLLGETINVKVKKLMPHYLIAEVV